MILTWCSFLASHIPLHAICFNKHSLHLPRTAGSAKRNILRRNSKDNNKVKIGLTGVRKQPPHLTTVTASALSPPHVLVVSMVSSKQLMNGGGGSNRIKNAPGGAIDDGSLYDDPCALGEGDPNYEDPAEQDTGEVSLPYYIY